MSAPSVLELALLGREAHTDERRSRAPLNVLGRELGDVVVGAVDAREIAAVLEAQGLNDAGARARFEATDVFATAEHLFKLVPYRPLARPLVRPTVRPDASLLRGLLYLLPALWFHDALRFLPVHEALLGLMAGILFGWGWTQGLSYFAYQQLGQGAGSLTRLSLLGVLLGGVLGGAVVAASGGGALLGALVALAVGSYFTASTLLVSLGRERWLLLSLLPAVLVSLSALALEALGAPGARSWGLAGLGLVVLVPTLVAAHALRRQGRRRPRRGTLPRALPFALVGWLYAAFLALDTVFTYRQSGLSAMLAHSAGAAPVVLCMGVMEWLSARQQTFMRHAARGAWTMRALSATGGRILLDTTAFYVVALVVVSEGWLLTLSLLGQSEPGVWRLCGHLVYGVALLASVQLANGGRVLWTLPAWALGVLVQALAWPHSPDLAYLLGGGAALIALLPGTFKALSDITSYR